MGVAGPSGLDKGGRARVEKYKGSLIESEPQEDRGGGFCLWAPGNKEAGPGGKRQVGREAARGCVWLVESLRG